MDQSTKSMGYIINKIRKQDGVEIEHQFVKEDSKKLVYQVEFLETDSQTMRRVLDRFKYLLEEELGYEEVMSRDSIRGVNQSKDNQKFLILNK